MKRGWTKSSLYTSTAVGVALLLATFSPIACGQTTSQTPSPAKDTASRVNELTLAGLRPGRDSLGDALETFQGQIFLVSRRGDLTKPKLRKRRNGATRALAIHSRSELMGTAS